MSIESRLTALEAVILGDPETTSVENRVFNVIVLLLFAASAVGTVSNTLLGLHWINNLLTILSVFSTFLLYLYSRRTKNYERFSLLFSYFTLVLLCGGFLLSGGTQGSLLYFFLLVGVAAAMYLRGFKKIVYLSMLAVVSAALLGIETVQPRLITHSYHSGLQRLSDISSTILMCFSIIALMVHIVIRQQKEEGKKLARALEEIKLLQEALPICSSCKKIRDDKGYWNKVETYFKDHAGVEFDFGLCPDCAGSPRGKKK